jgi:Uncharacterised nucleotidyltransferase
MRRLDVAPDVRLLVRLLRHPGQLAELTPSEFGRTIDAAEHARLLGWLLAEAGAHRAPRNPPCWLIDRLATVKARVNEYERAVKWEIDRVNRAFFGAGFPWILLKGGAYIAAALAPGRGRRVADIDVLVPLDDLAKAEAALREHGWEFGELHEYDARYYREWMHELPPLVHRERRSVVDLHHAILPRTSRRRPSTERLIERSVVVGPGVRVLCPEHMVLHAAAHLFHDGQIAGAVRDIVDLDALLAFFARDPGFWRAFADEARALDLERPAFYAVRYAHRLLGTPAAPEGISAVASGAPPAPVRWLMDALVDRTLSGTSGRLTSVAGLALYIRSHWLRMPPLLLARHLLRKSTRFS